MNTRGNTHRSHSIPSRSPVCLYKVWYIPKSCHTISLVQYPHQLLPGVTFAASGTLFGVLLPPRPIKVSLANLIFLAESEAEGAIVELGKGRFFPLQSPVVGESAATL